MSIGLFGPPPASSVPVPSESAETSFPGVPPPSGMHAGVVYMVSFGNALAMLFQAVGFEQTQVATAAIVDLAYELVDKEDVEYDPIEKLAPQVGVTDEDTAYALADMLFHSAIGLADVECPKEGLVATAVEQLHAMMAEAPR